MFISKLNETPHNLFRSSSLSIICIYHIVERRRRTRMYIYTLWTMDITTQGEGHAWRARMISCKNDITKEWYRIKVMCSTHKDIISEWFLVIFFIVDDESMPFFDIFQLLYIKLNRDRCYCWWCVRDRPLSWLWH